MRASVRKSICTENCVLEHEPLSKDVGVRKCPQIALNYCVGSTSCAENNVIEVKIIVSKTWNKNYSFNTKIPKQLEILSFLLTLKAKVQTSILLIHFLLLDNGVIDTDWPLIIIHHPCPVQSQTHYCVDSALLLAPTQQKSCLHQTNSIATKFIQYLRFVGTFHIQAKKLCAKMKFFSFPIVQGSSNSAVAENCRFNERSSLENENHTYAIIRHSSHRIIQ